MKNEEDNVSKVARGIRMDLMIAVCALLISTLAAGASWWQARVLQSQTHVLEEQLGAQVWPYVSVAEGINSDTVAINVSNDGLGPAILRSMSASVDGAPVSTFTGILHAILGPNLIARSPRGQGLGLTIDSAQSGDVIRPGERGPGFSLKSKRFSKPFLEGYRRLDFRLCYCAIIPGRCWLSHSRASGGPAPVDSCPEVRGDLLHVSSADELTHAF